MGNRLDAAGPAEVFGAGVASLLVELAVLRFVPGQIRVLGYFTNFVLLAAFVGLGVGIMAVQRFPRATWAPRLAPFGFLGLVGLAWAGHGLGIGGSVDEVLFLEYRARAVHIPLFPFLALSYVAIGLCFIPLGYGVGKTLAGERPLARYAWNIAGSLAGIAVFSTLSALSAPPTVWIGAAALSVTVCLLRAPAMPRVAGAIALCAAVVLAHLATRQAVWSPYQKITTAPLRLAEGRGVVQEWQLPRLTPEQRESLVTLPFSEGFTVRVNDDSYQTPLDLSDAALSRHPSLIGLRVQYDLPYKGRPPGRVLVLGAGTGNDVAAALRCGATHVDAVEIDPEILRLGRDHPERPYADPRVTTHLADARTFLAREDDAWDTIVYGLLDSHVLMSSMSNVRLDSYVFTAESFALARTHLAPGGVLFVSHAVGTRWFVQRMRATLAQAFGKPPLLVSEYVKHPLGFVYAAGDPVPEGKPLTEPTDVLSDDWPFVYLRTHAIPREYLIAMALVALGSLALVRVAAGRRLAGFDLHFFALGAGFLLLETRGLAVLALLIGSTSAVTSAVFAGVLVMALAATAVAHRLGESGASAHHVRSTYVLLAGALALQLAVPTSVLADFPFAARAVLGAVLVSLPLLASGTLFATSLARAGSADRALASNLLGAIVGGLVEYLSMVTGFRMLIVLAAVFYALAYLAGRRALSAPAPAS